jgi:hypothetical protein
MRDFSWNVFSKTGDVDAYLLYKQINDQGAAGAEAEDDDGLEDENDLIN